MQVRETVRDATFLHNEQFFAAAQKKYVYIYDKRGLEVHCLKVTQLPCLLPHCSQRDSLFNRMYMTTCACPMQMW